VNTSTTHHDRSRGIFLVMAASILWGTSGVASQATSALAVTNPLSLSFLRAAVAAPILLLSGWYMLRENFWPKDLRNLGLIFLAGALTAVDHALYFVAINYAGVTIATLVVICSAPILVTLFTALFQRRPVSSTTWQSIALAVIGTVLLVSGSTALDTPTVSLLGVAVSFAGGFVYAAVILLGRFLVRRCNPIQVTSIGFSAGAVLLFVISQLMGFASTYPVSGWLLILYMGIVPTALAYGMFHRGMRTTSAPTASVIVLLEPLTAAILAWIMFGEKLNIAGIGGAVLLLFTIYRLSTQESQE
jgi:drug/metabolite transporter, DME family